MSKAIVAITPEAAERLLQLNNAHATETSPLSHEAWQSLVGHAFHAVMFEDWSGFLIALDQGAPYPNVNHGWFRARYDRFVYVDRVHVQTEARGQGLASALYNHLFDRARAVGQRLVTCEINVKPPNAASDALHERLGFDEVGRQTHADRDKTVRYMIKALD